DGVDVRAADTGTGGIVDRRAFAIGGRAITDDVNDSQVTNVVKIDDAAGDQRILSDPVQVERVAAGLIDVEGIDLRRLIGVGEDGGDADELVDAERVECAERADRRTRLAEAGEAGEVNAVGGDLGACEL